MADPLGEEPMSEAIKAVVVTNQEPLESGPEAEKLIHAAIEHQVPVETMERLLVMRRELRAEKARDAYNAALAAFQSECPVISKRKGVAGKNDKLRYKYAPLDDIVDQVRELLRKHGFSYKFDTELKSNPPSQVAVCTAKHAGGHEESSSFQAAIDPDAYMNITQQGASASSFAKRYAFCNVFGILTGDDDDAQSVGQASPKETTSATDQRPDLREIACASCGERALIKGKEEYGGGWVCFKKKGGCGQKYNEDPATWGEAPDSLPDWAGGPIDKQIDDDAHTAAVKSANDTDNAFAFVEKAEISSSRTDLILKSIAKAEKDNDIDALKKAISESNADKNGGVLLPSDWERIKGRIAKAKGAIGK